ncbi:zinc finger protein CONSTANS-LIKE 4-like [Cajanus cajan]|uniref:zinc finger protein CONSTANS-LIKE 4-like n=1 Tax=Cajanus cajan TaxID=3821 RepID=UPI00098DB848|nr:zinc finger protein CONSTANS-LIKE 4-like [Cajanus cajan]
MAYKLCDSCKSTTATLYCRPDAAEDSKVHVANKLALCHPRVTLCEVCEQALAHITCKADAVALCLTCDRDIHSANPLASRHERLPVTPFFKSIHSIKASSPINFLDEHRFPSPNFSSTQYVAFFAVSIMDTTCLLKCSTNVCLLL